MRRRNVFQGDSKLNYDKNPVWKSKMTKEELMRYVEDGKMPDNSVVPIPWKRALNLGSTSDPENLKMSYNLGFTTQGDFLKTKSDLGENSLMGKVDLKKIRKIR